MQLVATRRSTSRKQLLLSAALVGSMALGPIVPAFAGSSSAPAPTLEQLLQALQAQQKQLDEQKRQLAEQADKIASQEQKLAAQAALLAQQRSGLKALDAQLHTVAATSEVPMLRPGVYDGQTLAQATTEPQLPQPVAPNTSGSPGAAGTSSGTGAAGSGQPENYQKPREQLLVDTGGVLIPPGLLQIQPEIDYQHFSGNQIAISGFSIFNAIVVGTISVDKLDTSAVTGSITARLGLPGRTQLDLLVPGVYREDTTTPGVGTSNAVDNTISNYGLGDIQAGIEWQPIIGHGWIPDTVLRVTTVFPTGTGPFDVATRTVDLGGGATQTVPAESPTGGGFFVIEPGFTALWKTDPVAFYAGATYKHGLSRKINDAIGTIQPGDDYEFFTGINLAISDQVGMSMGFDDQIVQNSTQNGASIPGSAFNDGRAILGVSVGLTPDITLLGSLEIGLTEQSPDFVFGLQLPITFNAF